MTNLNETTTSAAVVNKRGARPRYFVCVALKEGELVYDSVNADSKCQAEEVFEGKHGVKPVIVDQGEGSGYYVVKGGTADKNDNKSTVTVSAEQFSKRTPTAYSAQYKGWNVFASGLSACSVDDESFADNDLVSLEFRSRVVENGVVKPKLRKREVVKFTDLENVQPLNS